MHLKLGFKQGNSVNVTNLLRMPEKVVIRMDSPPWKGGVPIGRGG